MRLIDKPDVAILPAALAAASRCLARARDANKPDESQSGYDNILSAASLIADFGNAEEQQQLLDMLREGREPPHVTPVFRALVAGVANRYTGNRVPFLAMLLDDTRIMPDAGDATVRYCDMAIAHLSAIVDERLINVGATPTPADWEQARQNAKFGSAPIPRCCKPRVLRSQRTRRERAKTKHHCVCDSRRHFNNRLPQKSRKATRGKERTH